MIDTAGLVHVALVASKTKVAPIKQLFIPHLELCGAHLLADLLLFIPRLELCGAHLLADLLNHVKVLLHVPLDNIYA